MRSTFLRPFGRGFSLQQQRRLQEMRRHRHGDERGRIHPCPRPEPEHRPRRGSPLELADVGLDDRCVPRHGCPDRYSVQGPHSTGERHCLSRSCRQKAYPVQEQKLGRVGRNGFHLLQCRLHSGKRAFQGQGRQRDEARGEIPQAGHLSRLPRHPPQRSRARPAHPGHQLGRSLPNDAPPAGRMGQRHPRMASRRNAPDGRKHQPVLFRHVPPFIGIGSVLPEPGPSWLYPFYR